MQRFRDNVKYYNDLHVIGLVQGIERMMDIKITEGMDMFKDSVTLPGLTQCYLFRNLVDDYFTVFNKENKHFYKELKKNITGGPSLVFCRYQEKGEPLIKGKEPCERVIAYDANSFN